ncbi:MAG: alpha/beta hydrolase [Proteobacteria bacterium]|nr:alpha/beta hydrolase [Pseudomonadota bacterium]
MAPAAVTPPISIKALIARPHPKGAIRIAYGAAPAQFAELWPPAGPGPHPVVILVHGGCWQAQYGLDLMDWAAEDLRSRGVAVWNIEYRRLGEPGGGYPGTFQDVGQAVDLLRTQASKYHLKLDPVVAIGHSAGGHLALWAAARGRLPASSPLRVKDPLHIAAAISVGGLGDLETPSDACDGAPTVRQLIGEPSAARPQPMSDTSPAYLEPFPARQILVQGTLDKVSPPAFGEAYRAKARARGGDAEVTVVDGQAHFDMIAPGTTAWDTVIRPLAIGQLRGGRFGGWGAAARPRPPGPVG